MGSDQNSLAAFFMHGKSSHHLCCLHLVCAVVQNVRSDGGSLETVDSGVPLRVGPEML
jgi:hypothetical protein